MERLLGTAIQSIQRSSTVQIKKNNPKMKLLVVISLAAVLVATAQARPEPFFGKLFEALGFIKDNDISLDDVKAAAEVIDANQETIAAAQDAYNDNKELVDSVLTPENIDTAAAVYQENKQAADSLVKSILKFIFPFAKASNQNPFASFFTALVENMKASEAIKDSPATAAVVDAVTSIIGEMDSDLDPFNAAAKQANDMANALLGSAVEAMPNLMGAVLNLFMSTQSRSIGSSISDVFNPLINVVQDTVNLITTVATSLVGGTQKTVTNSVDQAMNCFKTIKSDNGFIGTLRNSLVCAETVLNETYNTANGIADILVNEISFTFMSAVNGTNGRIAGEIEKRLPEPFRQCGLGVTQTSTMVAQKLDNEIEGCVNTEVETVLNVLLVARNALGVTAGLVDAVDRMSHDCMSFRLISCGWAAIDAVFGAMHLGAAFTAVPVEVAKVSAQIQTRLPTCIAVHAATALTLSAKELIQVSSCSM